MGNSDVMSPQTFSASLSRRHMHPRPIIAHPRLRKKKRSAQRPANRHQGTHPAAVAHRVVVELLHAQLARHRQRHAVHGRPAAALRVPVPVPVALVVVAARDGGRGLVSVVAGALARELAAELPDVVPYGVYHDLSGRRWHVSVSEWVRWEGAGEQEREGEWMR
jgi:hypothetical protein